MQKKIITLALSFMCIGLVACNTKNEDKDALKTEPSTTTVTEQTSTQTTTTQLETTEAAQTTQTESAVTEQAPTEQTETAQTDNTVATSAEQIENKSDALTEDQALEAIKNYCFTNNPSLKNMVDSGEHTIYWNVTTNAANEIVVLYRSYTAAEMRYYIDPISGETYVTELVPGIIDEEQRTEESFNARNFLA